MVGSTIVVLQRFCNMDSAAEEAVQGAKEQHWKLYKTNPYSVQLIVKTSECTYMEDNVLFWKHVFEVKEIR